MSRHHEQTADTKQEAINLFNDGQGIMKSLLTGVMDMHDRNRMALDAMDDDTLAKAKNIIETLLEIIDDYEYNFVPWGKINPKDNSGIRSFLNITLRDAGNVRDEYMRQEAERKAAEADKVSP